MEYVCPNCKKALYKIENKLVCGTSHCVFQCLIKEYETYIQPWNIQICEDASL